MSNPAVYLLASKSIGGKIVRIEDNLGESIHIHVGEFRISLTIEEFENFSESVLDAARQLFELRDLDWKHIDLSALDWLWLGRYNNILAIEEKEYSLDTLYTSKKLFGDAKFKKIVPIKESYYYKALTGDLNALKEVSEVNMYSQDSKERLENIKNKIESQGYPYDGKLILVDSNGLIYDGAHRAACLSYLKGEKYKVPVLEMTFKNQDTIEQINKKTITKVIKVKGIGLLKKVIKAPFRLVKKIINKITSEIKKIHHKKETTKLLISKEELISEIIKSGIRFLVLDRPVRDANGTCLALCSIIIEKNRLHEIEKKLSKYELMEQPYHKYLFLYSTPRPLYIKVKEGKILVWDRVCCKSRFRNAFLPVDRYVLDEIWKDTKETTHDKEYVAGIRTNLLSIILNSILEYQKFYEEDIQYVEKYKSYFKDEIFLKMLEMEFFEFTQELILLLEEKKYNEAIVAYVSNKKY